MYNWSFGAGSNEKAWVASLLGAHVLNKEPLPAFAPEVILALLRVAGKWRCEAMDAEEELRMAREELKELEKMKERILRAIDHDCD